ncbi:MAG UNVERIFIED_CONTAM: hypothetical protein LVR18_10175 [Planctomycetaceae bacterium]
MKQPPHLLVEFDDPNQFFGPMEGEDCPAASVWFPAICESAFRSGRFVGERQRHFPRGEQFGQSDGVLCGLFGNACQSKTFRLRLDNSNRSGVGVEDVVCESGCERKLTNCHALPRRDIHLAVVLHDPARLFKLPVNLLAGFLFGGHASPFCNVADVRGC